MARMYDYDASNNSQLLREYTEKLRIACLERLKVKERQKINRMIFLSIFSAALAYAIYYFAANIADSAAVSVHRIFPELITSVFTLISFIFVWSSISYQYVTTQKVRNYETNVLASVLERLVREASSKSEHSVSQIENPLEFRIRLAEAEAALRMYDDIFDNRSIKIPSTFDEIIKSDVKIQLKKPYGDL